jgi:hypothetical protein
MAFSERLEIKFRVQAFVVKVMHIGFPQHRVISPPTEQNLEVTFSVLFRLNETCL